MSGTLYNPTVEQMVVIWHEPDSTREINKHLQDGWQVVSVTGAGAGEESDLRILFFVVLERRRS